MERGLKYELTSHRKAFHAYTKGKSNAVVDIVDEFNFYRYFGNVEDMVFVVLEVPGSLPIFLIIDEIHIFPDILA